MQNILPIQYLLFVSFLYKSVICSTLTFSSHLITMVGLSVYNFVTLSFAFFINQGQKRPQIRSKRRKKEESVRVRDIEKETEKRKKYDTLGEREIRSKRGKREREVVKSSVTQCKHYAKVNALQRYCVFKNVSLSFSVH